MSTRADLPWLLLSYVYLSSAVVLQGLDDFAKADPRPFDFIVAGGTLHGVFVSHPLTFPRWHRRLRRSEPAIRGQTVQCSADRSGP
jgi:hypothetical protein